MLKEKELQENEKIKEINMTSFKNDVKLFMVFDILGDTERTGPNLWQINRFRLEDIKDHILDLTLIARILKKYFPDMVDNLKFTEEGSKLFEGDCWRECNCC